jgi:hypothetical protein
MRQCGVKFARRGTPFLCKSLKKVRTEMSFSVLAYNLRRMIAILGVEGLKAALAR